MIKKLKYIISPALLFLPFFVFAAETGDDVVTKLIKDILVLTQRLVPTLIGLALAMFLFGVLRYLFSKDGPTKKEARDFMIWGIIALFVMVSVWGLIRVIQDVILGTGEAEKAETLINFPKIVVPSNVNIQNN